MEKLNQWLMLLTNLGVIAGLVILVYEVGQNTQALQNETDVAIYSMAANTAQAYYSSDELQRLVIKAHTEDWSEFSRSEKMMLTFYWGNEVDRAELQYRLYRRNQDKLDNIVFYEPDLRLASFQSWWKDSKELYERDFVEYFDALMSRDVD